MKSHPQADPYVICPACQALNRRPETFCDECGAAIGNAAALDPAASIHEQSLLPRKTLVRRPRPRVLIGYWAIFLPMFLSNAYAAIFWIRHRHGLAEFIFFWGAVGLSLLSFVILYLVTKNYLAREQKKMAREAGKLKQNTTEG